MENNRKCRKQLEDISRRRVGYVVVVRGVVVLLVAVREKTSEQSDEESIVIARARELLMRSHLCISLCVVCEMKI